RSTVTSSCLRNNDPLAPVVATVRFCGGGLGKGSSMIVGRSSLVVGRWRAFNDWPTTNDQRPKTNGDFMETSTSLGSRRNAAQMHALACVEREVRACDPSGRRKYLRDYNNAFRSYESVIDSQQLMTAVKDADVVLIGDYHALPSAQRFAATLLEQRAQPGDRPVVLGL